MGSMGAAGDLPKTFGDPFQGARRQRRWADSVDPACAQEGQPCVTGQHPHRMARPLRSMDQGYQAIEMACEGWGDDKHPHDAHAFRAPATADCVAGQFQ